MPLFCFKLVQIIFGIMVSCKYEVLTFIDFKPLDKGKKINPIAIICTAQSLQTENGKWTVDGG